MRLSSCRCLSRDTATSLDQAECASTALSRAVIKHSTLQDRADRRNVPDIIAPPTQAANSMPWFDTRSRHRRDLMSGTVGISSHLFSDTLLFERLERRLTLALTRSDVDARCLAVQAPFRHVGCRVQSTWLGSQLYQELVVVNRPVVVCLHQPIRRLLTQHQR